MKAKFVAFATFPSRFLANHIFGEHYTPTHRKICGIALCYVGVLISTISHDSNSMLISFHGDLLGYALHGAGLTPFIENSK